MLQFIFYLDLHLGVSHLVFGTGAGGFCADILFIAGEGGRTSFCLRGLGAGGFIRRALSLAAFFSD